MSRRKALQIRGFFVFHGLCIILIALSCLHDFEHKFHSAYYNLFIALNVILLAGAYTYARKTERIRTTTLFLATWCVVVGIVTSLAAEALIPLIIFWLPCLLLFLAFLTGFKVSLSFLGTSGSLLLIFFQMTSYLTVPDLQFDAQWIYSFIMNVVLSQLGFYFVLHLFESLRASDRETIGIQKQLLLQNTKKASTRALNRVLDKRLQACLDASQEALNVVQKGASGHDKIAAKALENILHSLDEFSRMSEDILSEDARSVPNPSFTYALEEFLSEDPRFHDVEIQFKLTLAPMRVQIPFQILYPVIEIALEKILQPWQGTSLRHVLVESELVQKFLHLHLTVTTQQNRMSWYHDDSESQAAPDGAELTNSVQQDCLRLGIELKWTNSDDSRRLTLLIPAAGDHPKAG